LTEDAEDVLVEFEYLLPRDRPPAQRNPGEDGGIKAALKFSDTEEKVMALIGSEEVAIDEVIRGSGLTSACVSATLLGLEMKRIIKQLPGKQYVRNSAVAD
jgi:DNA processing protein